MGIFEVAVPAIAWKIEEKRAAPKGISEEPNQYGPSCRPGRMDIMSRLARASL
jgi:hypothetical protein